MHIKLKNALQVLLSGVLIAQMGGCIFVDHDHYHHDHPAPAVVYVH